jgi:hypothetical protein
MSKKIKLNNCSICLKDFKDGESIKKESRFDGKLGIIPISLHKKCYNKLMKFDELILEDYS